MADYTTRRDFLKGRAAVEALRDKAAPLADELPRAAGPVLSLKRRAMACEFEVQLNLTADENETENALAALDLVETIESQITVYRDQSEVVTLNQTAADGPVVVEPRLFDVLQWMDTLHRLTDGAYDATSGPLSAAWGFSRRAGRVPTDEQRVAAMERVGWSTVRLGADRTVGYDRSGIEINLNSVGKGYALDRAAELLEGESVTDFLVQGGQSTIVARGARHTEDGSAGDGWGVGLRHPLRPEVRLAEFRLRDRAFSTSGSGTQGFVHGGRRYGHLLDPRTGWPAEGLHSVSVVAPTGAEADALSTALYVLGADAGAELLSAHPQWGALFVAPGKTQGEILLRDVNLPEDVWRRAATS